MDRVSQMQTVQNEGLELLKEKTKKIKYIYCQKYKLIV